MLTTHLRRFDIFQDQIDVKLEPAKGGVIGDVDLVLGIREKGRVFLKAGTEVGGGEGGFVRTHLSPYKDNVEMDDFVFARTLLAGYGMYSVERNHWSLTHPREREQNRLIRLARTSQILVC